MTPTRLPAVKDSPPAAPAGLSRPLVLVPAGSSLSEDPTRVLLSWAEAQQTGQRRFGQHAKFVCLPAQFPVGVVEHEREQMCRYLHQRIEEGATAVLLVPPSAFDATKNDEAWSRAAFVIESVTRTRIERIDGAYPIKFTIAPQCPPRIRAHLERHVGNFRLVVGTQEPQTLQGPDALQVLGHFQDPLHEPSASAGFVGEGAWLLLPWSGDQVRDADLSALLVLLDELDELRETRAARNAKERVALRSSLDRDDEAFRSGPDGRKRLARAPRTCEAPVKRLELPLLYAIPRGAESGFLQRRDEKTGRYLTSTLLGRGAWALATCLLRESLFCEGAKATLDLGVLEEALEASGIPIGKRASMSSYLTQLRRALRDVLGAKLGPRAIHVRKGTEAVEIRGLQAAVRAVGGSMVCPVR